jgi:hypothetical protein
MSFLKNSVWAMVFAAFAVQSVAFADLTSKEQDPDEAFNKISFIKAPGNKLVPMRCKATVKDAKTDCRAISGVDASGYSEKTLKDAYRDLPKAGKKQLWQDLAVSGLMEVSSLVLTIGIAPKELDDTINGAIAAKAGKILEKPGVEKVEKDVAEKVEKDISFFVRFLKGAKSAAQTSKVNAKEAIHTPRGLTAGLFAAGGIVPVYQTFHNDRASTSNDYYTGKLAKQYLSPQAVSGCLRVDSSIGDVEHDLTTLMGAVHQ